jgi:hypothetical protein
MMERELRAYRANPTDARFVAVYRIAQPWLRSAAIATVGRYHNLTISGAVDDVVLEGALAISSSARRFVYLCDCGRAFVHVSDLAKHQRETHLRRGGCEVVSLERFVTTSARLAMKRTARRIVRPEILDPEVESTEFDGLDPCRARAEVEARVVFAVLVSSVRDRLSARARVNLECILRRDLPTGEAVEELRREVTNILHSG